MPHLRLKLENASRLSAQYGLTNAEETAAFLGVDVDHVRDVCEHGGYPSEEFIAACLLKVPTRFDELFEVIEGECSLAA